MELDRWCYANERGEISPSGEADLRSALSQGNLGPDTWVWRSGWKQWLRAAHVRQFSNALGDRARDIEDPLIDLRQRQPPPPPKFGGETAPSPRFSTPIPPPHRQKPLVRRPPIPTIDEAASSLGGDTLRPPGAVPPPPRGTPKTLRGEAESWDLPVAEDLEGTHRSVHEIDVMSRRPSNGSIRHSSGNGLDAALEASSALSSVNEERNLDVPAEELSAPIQPALDQPPISYDPDSIENRPSTPNLHVRVWAHMRHAPRERRIATALVAIAVVTLALGAWLTLRKPQLVPRRDARPEATQPTPAKPQACSVVRPAQRISPSILMSVAPIVADATAGGRLVVGFAEGSTIAAGLSIDPTDLDVTYPFREANAARVVSVTPLLHSGQPSFYVVRESQTLKQARAVAASVDFLFGLSDAGFSRQPLTGSLDTVWAVESKANVTDPRIASLAGLGHAVTFRQGGTAGSLHLGWLTEDGHAMAGPFQIKSPVSMLGTPSVASGGRSAIVAYAGRNSEGESWAIHLAFGQLGQPPKPAVAFAEPAGGPGGDAIAPTIVALPNDRWLLQWSEGAQGQRQVRIQTLDGDGRPLGLAHTVSPVGSNSGQGLIWSSRERAVSLFMVSVGRSAELWATPISCPE